MNSTHFLNFADLPEILPFLVLAVLDLCPKSQRIHKQGQQHQMWPSLHQLQEVILVLCAVHGTTGKQVRKEYMITVTVGVKSEASTQQHTN